MSGASQNIPEPEPPETKDAFVPSIMAIKAVTLSVMDAGSGQMTHPPDLSPRHFCENGRMKEKWKAVSEEVQ